MWCHDFLKKKGRSIVLIQYPDKFVRNHSNVVQNVKCTFSWVYCTLVFGFLCVGAEYEADALYRVLMLAEEEMIRHFIHFNNLYPSH